MSGTDAELYAQLRGKMKITCVVPAAGKGRRLGFREDKPFVMLGRKPILAHTLKVFEACPFIDDIILVVLRNKIKTARSLVKKYGLKKIRSIVSGGKRRFDSVKNGLKKLDAADYVVIHDGVRPFIDSALIKRVFVAARKFGAALSCIPSKQTLKLVGKNFIVAGTPKRKSILEAQTPQIFRKELIVGAYKKAKNRNATDDASLVENLGHKVKIVKGSYRNIKITTPEDLALAKLLIKRPTRSP